MRVALSISRYLADSLAAMQGIDGVDPAPFCTHGEALFEMPDAQRLIDEALPMGAQAPFTLWPHLPRRYQLGPTMMRYNRVEALSLGLGGTLDFGRLAADGLVRMGIADRRLNFELGLTRRSANARFDNKVAVLTGD